MIRLKTITLVDTLWVGHHPTYFKLFSKTILSLGYRVIAFCPQPDEVKKWISLNCPEEAIYFHANEFNQSSVAHSSRSISAQKVFDLWQATADIINKNCQGRNPDLVFFNWLDSYLSPFIRRYILDKVFPYKWAGLYFHPTELRMPPRCAYFRRGILDRNNLLKSKELQAKLFRRRDKNK